MTTKEAVVSMFAEYSTLSAEAQSHYAQEVASALGREMAQKRGLSASARKDGVSFKDISVTRLPATPACRLFAACSQLRDVVEKITSSKGAYQTKLAELPRVDASGLERAYRNEPVAVTEPTTA